MNAFLNLISRHKGCSMVQLWSNVEDDWLDFSTQQKSGGMIYWSGSGRLVPISVLKVSSYAHIKNASSANKIILLSIIVFQIVNVRNEQNYYSFLADWNINILKLPIFLKVF